VLQPDGTPLAGVRVRLLLETGEEPNHFIDNYSVDTDDEGRFARKLPLNSFHEAWVMRMRAEDESGKPLGRVFEFDDMNRELGDLLLEFAPLLAHGQVLDDEERPIPGAKIEVALCFGDPTREGVEDGEEMPGWLAYYWHDTIAFDGISDEAGVFRLYGRPPDAHLALHAFGGKVVPGKRTVFEPGDRDLQVLTVHPGTIDGRLILPEFVDPKQLRLSLEEGKAIARLSFGSGSRFRDAAPEPSGRFRLGGIPFEQVALCVFFSNLREPLLTIEEVPITFGGTSCDPRLEAIDLSSHLHDLKLRVVDEGGLPVKKATVTIRPAGGKGKPALRRPVRNGELRCTIPWEQIDIVMRAEGYRARTCKNAVSLQEVVLESR
jgi:hypothetical protein